MRNSRRAHILQVAALVAVLAVSTGSAAQVIAEGYTVERLNPGAPGNTWVMMDELKLEGPLGGAVSLVTSYARHPLRVSAPASAQSLSVISDQAFVNVGMALLYDRYRLTLNIPGPLYAGGQSGNLANTQFTAPSLDIGKVPDKVTDFTFGIDTRLWGTNLTPLRMGASAQLFVPSGEKANYGTDGTFRSVVRAQIAGNWGMFNHAAFVGAHLRPRDDSAKLGSPSLAGPRGSELIVGLALAPQMALSRDGKTSLGVGPELFAETAFKAAFSKYTTALEALLSSHLSYLDEHGSQVRFKVGAGRGLNAQFGAPTWRMVLGLEISDRIRH